MDYDRVEKDSLEKSMYTDIEVEMCKQRIKHLNYIYKKNIAFTLFFGVIIGGILSLFLTILIMYINNLQF